MTELSLSKLQDLGTTDDWRRLTLQNSALYCTVLHTYADVKTNSNTDTVR